MSTRQPFHMAQKSAPSRRCFPFSYLNCSFANFALLSWDMLILRNFDASGSTSPESALAVVVLGFTVFCSSSSMMSLYSQSLSLSLMPVGRGEARKCGLLREGTRGFARSFVRGRDSDAGCSPFRAILPVPTISSDRFDSIRSSSFNCPPPRLVSPSTCSAARIAWGKGVEWT